MVYLLGLLNLGIMKIVESMKKTNFSNTTLLTKEAIELADIEPF